MRSGGGVALNRDEARGAFGRTREGRRGPCRKRVDSPLAGFPRLLPRVQVAEAREPLRLGVVLALAGPVQDSAAADHPSEVVRRCATAPDEAEDLVREEAQTSCLT